MSGCSAFTHRVRFKIPLTPFDFAQGRLRQAMANGILNRSTAVFRIIHSPTCGVCVLLLRLFTILWLLLTNGDLWAESAEPDPRESDDYDLMNWLAGQGLHDLSNENWNAYGQLTYIYNWKPSFPALYTNLNGSPNSLLPTPETGFTATATGFFAIKVWQGGEIYAVPEVISERPFSDLKGLGGVIQNFELQKNGGEDPILYLSRVFFKQSFGLGGTPLAMESDPMQLGTTEDSHRLVFNIGNFSILDIFDKNQFSGDLRRQFLNMAFLTYAAYDFAADARGYTWGGTAQYIHDEWAFRYGRIIAPYHPNQLTLNWNIFQYYGDQVELEHKHVVYDQPGVIRVLGFRNRENMGRFSDAIAAYEANPDENATTCQGFNYGSQNASAPDLCWARKPNIKLGIGINIEQQISENIGVFLRGMYNDGKTEVYSYTSTDRSLSMGALVKGGLWGRNRDLAGLGYAQGWISKSHAQYLGMGGIDGFIGDGAIQQASEHAVDLFYSFNIWKPIWITADYQYIANPAYNADRGPLNIYSARFHAEF